MNPKTDSAESENAGVNSQQTARLTMCRENVTGIKSFVADGVVYTVSNHWHDEKRRNKKILIGTSWT